MTVDRLTALDASFVWFERPGVPIHVGAVATFEAAPLLDGSGRLRLAELREHIGARLDALPRLRRRLAPVPFDLDRPRWVDDPDFDIAHHVGDLRLPPPGDDAALRQIAGDLQGQMLRRDRPLWDLHFVTGLSGDRVGLVERIHHALIGGVSGVELASLLLELDPDAAAPPAPPPWSPARPPDRLSLLAAGLRDRLTDPMRAAPAVADLALHPSRAVRAATTVAQGVRTMVDEGLLAPRTSLNAPLAGSRHLAWVPARLDDVRAAGRGAEASVNDVVLTAVAGGLRWLFLE